MKSNLKLEIYKNIERNLKFKILKLAKIIDEMFYDDGKYKNDLDYLLNVRQCTNPKIKFEILNATEKQKKCFESAGLF